MLKRTITLLLLALATCARSDDRFGTLYQPLIDRFPFGKPDPGEYDENGKWIGKGPDSDSAASPEEVPLSEQEEALKKSVSATLLNRDPVTSCLQVGFTDLSNAQSPRPHLVAVGSSEDGWLVKAVDENSKTVTFVKNGVSVDVVVGAAAAPAPSDRGKTPVGRPVNSRAPGGRSPLLSGARGGAAAGPPGSPGSMRSLRQQRHERELAQQRELDAARQAREEELARQREELARQREEEKARAEAERAADREEYKARLNDLAAQLEQKMAEKRNAESEEDEEEEEGDDD